MLAGVLAVSCGSGGDGDPAPSDALSDVTGASRSIGELIDDLEGVGCPLEEVTPTEGFDIYRQASCPDAELQVYTFTSRGSRDEVVDGILGIEGEFAVVGANWVAEARTQDMADAVKAKIGGTVRAATA
jgi:hypothetical protein